MRRNSTLNTEETKRLARNKYAERQIDKWVKWSWNMRGKVLYRELMEKIKQYPLIMNLKDKQQSKWSIELREKLIKSNNLDG